MLPADGRVGLLYRADERTQAYPEAPDQQEKRWLELLAEADILFDLHPTAMDLVADHAPRLKWIQGIASGAGEAFNHPGIRDSQVVITTARGVHDGPLADFAMASFLAHAKRFDHLQELGNARSWDEFPGRRVSGAHVVIVGYGSIGQAIARRALSFDTTSHADDGGVPALGMESLDDALAVLTTLQSRSRPRPAPKISSHGHDSLQLNPAHIS
jgi:phosphoglycerate dehydrogenase-like enzyme